MTDEVKKRFSLKVGETKAESRFDCDSVFEPDRDSVLTPIKEGTTNITVTTANGKKATLKVKVVDPTKATSVTLMHESSAYHIGQTVTLHVGDTLTLDAVMTPETATSTLKWKTSSSKYTTLDTNSGSKVSVTAKAVGKSTITVIASSANRQL